MPLYAVFTNEQLAEIARRRVDTLSSLGDVPGVGDARVERYGRAVLERVARLSANEGEVHSPEREP